MTCHAISLGRRASVRTTAIPAFNLYRHLRVFAHATRSKTACVRALLAIASTIHLVFRLSRCEGRYDQN